MKSLNNLLWKAINIPSFIPLNVKLARKTLLVIFFISIFLKNPLGNGSHLINSDAPNLDEEQIKQTVKISGDASNKEKVRTAIPGNLFGNKMDLIKNKGKTKQDSEEEDSDKTNIEEQIPNENEVIEQDENEKEEDSLDTKIIDRESEEIMDTNISDSEISDVNSELHNNEVEGDDEALINNSEENENHNEHEITEIENNSEEAETNVDSTEESQIVEEEFTDNQILNKNDDEDHELDDINSSNKGDLNTDNESEELLNIESDESHKSEDLPLEKNLSSNEEIINENSIQSNDLNIETEHHIDITEKEAGHNLLTSSTADNLNMSNLNHSQIDIENFQKLPESDFEEDYFQNLNNKVENDEKDDIASNQNEDKSELLEENKKLEIPEVPLVKIQNLEQQNESDDISISSETENDSIQNEISKGNIDVEELNFEKKVESLENSLIEIGDHNSTNKENEESVELLDIENKESISNEQIKDIKIDFESIASINVGGNKITNLEPPSTNINTDSEEAFNDQIISEGKTGKLADDRIENMVIPESIHSNYEIEKIKGETTINRLENERKNILENKISLSSLYFGCICQDYEDFLHKNNLQINLPIDEIIVSENMLRNNTNSSTITTPSQIIYTEQDLIDHNLSPLEIKLISEFSRAYKIVRNDIWLTLISSILILFWVLKRIYGWFSWIIFGSNIEINHEIREHTRSSSSNPNHLKVFFFIKKDSKHSQPTSFIYFWCKRKSSKRIFIQKF